MHHLSFSALQGPPTLAQLALYLQIPIILFHPPH